MAMRSEVMAEVTKLRNQELEQAQQELRQQLQQQVPSKTCNHMLFLTRNASAHDVLSTSLLSCCKISSARFLTYVRFACQFAVLCYNLHSPCVGI